MCMKAATYAKHFSAGLIVIPSHPFHTWPITKGFLTAEKNLINFHSAQSTRWAESISGIGLTD